MQRPYWSSLRQTFSNRPVESGSTNVARLSLASAPHGTQRNIPVAESTRENFHVSSVSLSEKRRSSTARVLSGELTMR